MNLNRVLPRLIFLASFTRICFAEEIPAPQPQSSPPPIRELGGGVFQIGGVKFDKTAKTATFLATVNMTAGLLEYLLVGTGGKTHESLFATDIEPYHLHLAMLLIGVKASAQAAGQATPPSAIDSAYLKTVPELKGGGVTISVRWKIDRKETVVPAEDLVMNDAMKKSMTRGPWIYNGSSISEGKFLAQEELAFVALVTDPVALVNNPRPGHDDDAIWSINTGKVPPLNTPVEITIKIESSNSTTQRK